MAYNDYGAFVFCNGHLDPSRSDAYITMGSISKGLPSLLSNLLTKQHHAILGDVLDYLTIRNNVVTYKDRTYYLDSDNCFELISNEEDKIHICMIWNNGHIFVHMRTAINEWHAYSGMLCGAGYSDRPSTILTTQMYDYFPLSSK